MKPIDAAYTAKHPDNNGGIMSRNDSNTNIVYIMQRLRELNMLVPDSNMGADVRGEYRRIKRPLLSNAFGRSASLVDQGRLAADRVRAVSYGEDTKRLVAPQAAGRDNPAAMANRRVVLVVEHATQSRAAMSSSSES